MWAIRRHKQISKRLGVSKQLFAPQSQLAALLNPSKNANAQEKEQNCEYAEVAKYPEIKEISFHATQEAKREEFREGVRKARTIEEKILKINMPRYYGYKVTALNDTNLPYNCLPAIQHYTRTVYEDSGLPNETEEQKVHIDSHVAALKAPVLETLEFANDFYRCQLKYADLDAKAREPEKLWAQIIVEQLHRTVCNGLMADFGHLKEAEVDYNPRHEAFWFVGGIQPPKLTVKRKKGHKWQKEYAEECIDRAMQYTGTPLLAVRHKQQLPTWKSAQEYENLQEAKAKIPMYIYDPRTLNFEKGFKHATNIPGYWPASHPNFGCISYQSLIHKTPRPTAYGEQDHKEALHAQAIQGSFTWLLAQANYNGFNTFSELTYPMNTQTVLTNGRDWSFYEYQLNTLLMHGQHVYENPRMNFCRGSAQAQLYQEFDAAGKCVGFNETVLRQLIRFYANAPSVQRTQAELRPYLDEHYRSAADYEDEDKREFLESTFKHISSNRPRHLEIPEIYLWEKFYKIDHKTRSMDAKQRFFEVGVNPWLRTLDQHHPEYIPKVLRPGGPKSPVKFKKTYYP